MKIFEVYWNEPGLGLCQAWKVSEKWFGFSAPGIEGTETTFKKAMETLEAYIDECKEAAE